MARPRIRTHDRRGTRADRPRPREGPALAAGPHSSDASSNPTCNASCSASFFLVCSPRLQPAAQWVRGPPCRPAGTRTGANAASCIRRTSRQADCSGAPPKPTSVTQPQPGGSDSSVELVDGIGSSFPLGATAGAPVAARSVQYPPRPPPCEPQANRAFANSLVRCITVTRTSSPRDLPLTHQPESDLGWPPTLCPWHCPRPRRTPPRSSPARRPASGRRSHANWPDAATD